MLRFDSSGLRRDPGTVADEAFRTKPSDPKALPSSLANAFEPPKWPSVDSSFHGPPSRRLTLRGDTLAASVLLFFKVCLNVAIHREGGREVGS